MINPTPKDLLKRYVSELIPDHLTKLCSSIDWVKVSAMGSLSNEYYTLAILEWHLHSDAAKYKEYMKVSVNYDQKRFEYLLSQKPETQCQSPITRIFVSLNSGDSDLTSQYVQFLDDHHNNNIRPTHPADWMYRCLIVLVLNRQLNEWKVFIDKLKKAYSTKKWSKLYPLALMLEAIWDKDEVVFNEQAQLFASSYKSMTRGIFSDYEDKLLSLWGLGICNLAAMKGLKITIDHQFIPRELIG
jgi:hypothetical protein